MTISRRDRVLGGMWGLLVGDAGGVPYENKKASELPEEASSSDWDPFVIHSPYKRSHSAQPANVYSDDGSQALCLLASCLQSGGFDPQDFGERLVRWFDHGYLAAHGTSFGSGGTTREALARIRSGVPASEAGFGAEHNLSNGALMRALPAALIRPLHSRDQLRELATAQARVTHSHPRSTACVTAYTIWARNILDEVADPADGALEALGYVIHSAGNPVSLEGYEVQAALCGVRDGIPSGGFHVVDTFASAVDANRRGETFADVLRHAIRFGGDTDTTAAVACGIAGLRFGLAGIPEGWINAVNTTLTPEVLDLFAKLEIVEH